MYSSYRNHRARLTIAALLAALDIGHLTFSESNPRLTTMPDDKRPITPRFSSVATACVTAEIFKSKQQPVSVKEAQSKAAKEQMLAEMVGEDEASIRQTYPFKRQE